MLRPRGRVVLDQHESHMRLVKAHKPGGTPTGKRLAEVCAMLGPVGKKLLLAWLEEGGGTKPGQRQLGDALLAFASELMRKEFVHTPALIAVAQRLIEGANPPDVATIAGAVYDVLAESPRARTAEGRRDLALALTGLAKQLVEARFPRTHGLLDLARLLLHEESAIL